MVAALIIEGIIQVIKQFTQLYSESLPGCLSFPVPSLLQGPVEGDCTGSITGIHTAAAIPAFLGVKNNRRFAFLGVGYIYIYLTYFYTLIAAVTDIRVEYHRRIRCRYVWHGVYFFLSHRVLLIILLSFLYYPS
jgi:hypothetical protein